MKKITPRMLERARLKNPLGDFDESDIVEPFTLPDKAKKSLLAEGLTENALDKIQEDVAQWFTLWEFEPDAKAEARAKRLRERLKLISDLLNHVNKYPELPQPPDPLEAALSRYGIALKTNDLRRRQGRQANPLYQLTAWLAPIVAESNLKVTGYYSGIYETEGQLSRVLDTIFRAAGVGRWNKRRVLTEAVKQIRKEKRS
jgi:hypothetical protein